MRIWINAGLALLCAGVSAGCATRAAHVAWAYEAAPGAEPARGETVGRMRIWRAGLDMQVRDLAGAAEEAAAVAAGLGGFLESRSDHDERSARLILRVPAASFEEALEKLGALGRVTRRSVSSQDVTEQVIDLEARLRNRVALRDRLVELLDRAAQVQDILAIEAELNRVQADIDSMEGRRKALAGQVDMASITLDLSRTPIPGPLGYALKGLWWGIEKLFLIRR